MGLVGCIPGRSCKSASRNDPTALTCFETPTGPCCKPRPRPDADGESPQGEDVAPRCTLITEKHESNTGEICNTPGLDRLEISNSIFRSMNPRDHDAAPPSGGLLAQSSVYHECEWYEVNMRAYNKGTPNMRPLRKIYVVTSGKMRTCTRAVDARLNTRTVSTSIKLIRPVASTSAPLVYYWSRYYE